MHTSSGFSTLTQELTKLPGIGQKTAARLAYYLLNQPEKMVEDLAGAMLEARKNVRFCSKCCTLTDQDICPICADEKRDQTQIMVVESPRDVEAYEHTGRYKGVYHVLHGVFSPMDGLGFSGIRLKELMQRLQEGEVSEVIIATSSTTEGETTAMYISRSLKNLGIKTSRIASGVPVGAELEGMDYMTLSRALEERRIL